MPESRARPALILPEGWGIQSAPVQIVKQTYRAAGKPLLWRRSGFISGHASYVVSRRRAALTNFLGCPLSSDNCKTIRAVARGNEH